MHDGRGTCMAEGHAWQGGMHSRSACMAGGMHGRRCAWYGACMARAMHAGETPTEAGDMHPTGMHSCFPTIY